VGGSISQIHSKARDVTGITLFAVLLSMTYSACGAI